MLTVGSFGFILFAALLAGLWRVTPQPRRWQLMLAASLVFYLSLDWQGCLLLCLMTLLVWQAALHLRGSPRWFYVGLAGALAPLTLLRLRPAALLLGQAFSLRIWDVSVPQVLGIGYFSLQLTSYLVDVRRGKQEPESQYARLLCFASFFLSITQGPFNRYDELMPQLDAAAPQPGQWQRGAQRCFWGYFKKLAVADRAALAVNAAFADPSAYDRSQLFLCAVLYVFQLYADFSGYTDIVLGAGEMLGLPLPENFRQPFLAATIRELWDRWHISLSRWLKDYVYIPLGGSRCSAARRDGNIIATFLVSGLWHGAQWNYMAWGLLNGLYQVIGAALMPLRTAVVRALHIDPKSRPHKLLRVVVTFVLFSSTMVFFRAYRLMDAVRIFISMLTVHNFEIFTDGSIFACGIDAFNFALLGIYVLVIFAADVCKYKRIKVRSVIEKQHWLCQVAVVALGVLTVLLLGVYGPGFEASNFIYSQF